MGNRRSERDSTTHPFDIEQADELPSVVPSDSDAMVPLAFLTQEVNAYMGKDFIAKIPLDVMERYCMATVDRDEPTGELLYKLLLNFMVAYSDSKTSEDALKAFDFLDYLTDKES